MLRDHPGRGHRAVVAALGCALCAVALTGCGGSQDTGSSPPPPTTTSSPDTASFSGLPPSALASQAASAIASAHASASAAASSASARASEFEASVDAELARTSAAAEKVLKNVEGRGNAVSEVGMTGLPRNETRGLLAVLVTITNKTDNRASYAVQIDFVDASGKVVETRFVGAENLDPGEKQQPIAFSRQPADAQLTPRLTKAQRY
ncbi:FxLYD domain-containing protein [Streptomyces sp. NPDC048521]|uniref:FxLYD domain-containing protein n=1 Tax=Streptomyces sp. NPDC048521 TaxID=3365566 RepID=UPI0037101F43